MNDPCLYRHFAILLLFAAAGGSGCSSSNPVAPDSPLALSVSSVLPTTGSVGGGTMLGITGTGFADGATVTLKGVAAQIRSITYTSIVAVTPAASSSGAVDVTVTNPDGRRAQLGQGFTYVIVGSPSIAAVSASPGSTEGGAWFRITGANFDASARVSFGGTSVVAGLSEGELVGTTPAHAAGTVDVTVTNPDGQTATLARGYTYVEPATLDFNGTWEGYGSEAETTLRFTIRGNVLTDISCGPSLGAPPTVSIAVSPQAAVSNGAVTFAGGEGQFRGRILTRSAARGTLAIERCVAGQIIWFAEKRN